MADPVKAVALIDGKEVEVTLKDLPVVLLHTLADPSTLWKLKSNARVNQSNAAMTNYDRTVSH